MTTTLEPVTKASRRRRGIEPYLLQIEVELTSGAPRSMRFIAAGPDAPAMPLDAWAVEWIQAYARKPKGPAELPELLKQCLAFLAKSATDVARLGLEAPRAGADFYALQAELLLGSAVGMALLRETQKAVDDLVTIGSVDDARALARFQNRLRSMVRELKQSLATSNRGRDDELVEEFTDQAAPAAAPPVAVAKQRFEAPEDSPAEPRLTAQPVTRRAKVAGVVRLRGHLRTQILLGSVMVALVVWLAGRAVPALTGRSAKGLSRTDFTASAPILQIVAPPPSAYVVVDPARWADYDEGQQRRLVEAISGVLAVNEYWGLLVRTPDGKAVARWVDGRGSELLHDAPALKPRDAAAPQRFDRFVPTAVPQRDGPGAGEGARRMIVP